MRIKHLLTVLGLSLVSLGMSAQITINVTDNAEKAKGGEKHHKIRFDYVICDNSNKIVKVDNIEFTMKPGETKQTTITAPAGYHVDPFVHLQLRQKPGDDNSWHNSPYGLGTFYVTNGRIYLVIEGSSKKGYELMTGAATTPKLSTDSMSGDAFRDAQNAKKGQLSLGGQRANTEAHIKALEEKAANEKKAAEEKAAAEKAAVEARKMADFNRVVSVSGGVPEYLSSSLKVVVRDLIRASAGGRLRLRLDYILCDASNHEMQKVDYAEISLRTGNQDTYTKEISIPSGYVIKNRQIHYELRASYKANDAYETAESGVFTVSNEKLDGVYVLKAFVDGSMVPKVNGSRPTKPPYIASSYNNLKSSPFVRDSYNTTGSDFASNTLKQINDAKAAKAAAEKKAAEDKAAAEKKVTEEKEAKKYGLSQIKVSVNDMASSDGPQCKHRIFLDYVICDKNTGAVKDVKRTTILLNGDNDTKSVTLTAPEGCVIRDGIHAEISSRSSNGGASYVTKITGIFKYGSANTLSINLYGTTDALSLKSAGSSPFTKDALSADAFKTANLPK